MTTYYVYRSGSGKTGRVAKIVDRMPYGYDNGQWVFMPSLTKIMHDVTADYFEISEEEAMRLIKEKDQNGKEDNI